MNASTAPRPSCLDCVRKHIGQSAVLFQEALQGYPDHRWLALGHLAEAESESQAICSDFAGRLRNERRKCENEDSYVPDCMALLGIVSNLNAHYGCDKVGDRNASCNLKGCKESDMESDIAGRVASKFERVGALISRQKLYDALKKLKRDGLGVNLPSSYKEFRNETYGRKSMIYVDWKTSDDKKQGESELSSQGFRIRRYDPPTTSEVQVTYFKGLHWDE